MCELYNKKRSYYNIIIFIMGFMTILSSTIKLTGFSNREIEKLEAASSIIERYILQVQFSLNENSILHFFLFIAILYLYHKFFRKKYNKRVKNVSFIIAALVGPINVLGYVLDKQNSWDAIFSTKFGIFKGFICSIGICIAFYVLILCLCEIVIPYIANYNMKENKYLKGNWKTILFVFMILVIAWLPYYFILYPGPLTPDGRDQIAQILNDYESCVSAKRLDLVNENVLLNTHHPIAYTLYLGIFVKFGQLINNINLGIGLFTFSQLLLCAFILTLSVYFMIKMKFSKIITIGTIVFFALWPMNPLFSVTITKDYIFALMSLLSTIVIYVLMKKPHLYRNKKFMIFTFFCLLGMLLAKGNGKYMILFMLVFVVIGVKQYKWHLVATLIIPYAIYSVLIVRILFSAFDITSEGSKMAMIYMPSQQVARCLVEHPDEITEEEKEAICKVFKCDGDVTYLASRFDPTRNTPILQKYNARASTEELIEFFKCWLGMVKKYPATCIEATANLNYRLLYFDAVGNTFYTNVVTNEYGIEGKWEKPKVILRETINTLRALPVISTVFYIGIYSWIIIISIGLFIARRQYSEIIPIGFCIANVFLNIIGPLMQMRYALQWIICVPFIIGMVVKAYNEDEVINITTKKKGERKHCVFRKKKIL